MPTVPYTFATASGDIPLSQLDANFSNVKAFANTAGTVTTAAQPNITSVGTLSSLSVTGNISGGNVNSTFYGSGTGLSSLTGANVTGTVANATYAVSAGSATTSSTAGTVTTASQPNITSLGTLTSLSVTGNVTSGNLVTSGLIVGNGTELSSLTGANVTGTVALATQAATANVANSVAGANVSGQVANALIAGTVYNNAQPNITSVGTLTSLAVTGNITSGNISGNTVAASGNVTGANLIASSEVSAPTITTNNIVSDDSTFVTVQDGLNVDGDVDAVNLNVSSNVNFSNGSKFSSAAWILIESLTADFSGSATQMVTMGNTPATLQSNYNELYIRLQGPNSSLDHTSTIIPTPDIIANSTVSLGILPGETGASQVIWSGLGNASIRILQSAGLGGTGNIVIYAR
jgi:hypothetical protein